MSSAFESKTWKLRLAKIWPCTCALRRDIIQRREPVSSFPAADHIRVRVDSLANTQSGLVKIQSQSLIIKWTFKRLVLGCIDADFCKQILIGISYLFEKNIEKRDMERDWKMKSSWRDLQDLHAFAPLRPQYFSKLSSNVSSSLLEILQHSAFLTGCWAKVVIFRIYVNETFSEFRGISPIFQTL